MPEDKSTADVLEEIEQDGRQEIPADETEHADSEESGETEETAHADSNETEHEKEKKRLGGWQRKILKAEAERDYWKDQAIKTRPEPKKEASETAKTPTPKPTPDKFDTYEEFVEAFTDWKAEQKFQQLSAQEKEQAQKNELEERARETLESFSERLKDFREEHDDYDERVGSIKMLQEVGNAVQNALLEDDHGPQLAYHLGEHPEIWQRMNEMTPTKALAYLGRLSERLFPETEEEEDEDEPVLAKSKTPSLPVTVKRPPLPAPITPTRKSAPTDKGLSDSLSPDEWQRRFKEKMGYK